MTDGYTPPADACPTDRALLGGLAELEADLHRHIHEENNILFPRARAAEDALQRAAVQ
jgi:regulator of cell morphogenesis and NO signaling